MEIAKRRLTDFQVKLTEYVTKTTFNTNENKMKWVENTLAAPSAFPAQMVETSEMDWAIIEEQIGFCRQK